MGNISVLKNGRRFKSVETICKGRYGELIEVSGFAVLLTDRHTSFILKTHERSVAWWHDIVWGEDEAEKQRRYPKPLAHPISCCTEFKARFRFQTVRIHKIKLVDKAM
jgi:hypothetical protein